MRWCLLVLAACATAAPPPPESPPGHLVEDMQDLARSLRTAPYETLLEVVDGPVAYWDLDTLKNGVVCPGHDIPRLEAWAAWLAMPTRPDVGCHDTTRSRRRPYRCSQFRAVSMGGGDAAKSVSLEFVRLPGRWRLVGVMTFTVGANVKSKLVDDVEEPVMEDLVATARCP